MPKQAMFSVIRWLGVAVLALGLSACGSGNDADEVQAAPAPTPTVGTGEVLAASDLGQIAAADIAQALAIEDSLVQGLVPRYAVRSYRLEYRTLDAQGQSVRASGLVSVPVKANGARSPVLSYQHGTLFRDAEAPSNHAVPGEVAVVMASLGYIVVAPDYVGYGVSKGTPHPYLLAEPSAAAVVDLLSAAQVWRKQQGIADNGQLFLTGYSEGGYVTMAAHRALQASNSPLLQQLRLVVPGAGPYSVQATMDGLVDLVRDEQPVLGALISPNLLRYLGSGTRREVKQALLKHLLPDDADVVFDTRFIDHFLADEQGTLQRISNVHDWRPAHPVRLYHGRDDRTVPYRSSTTTLQAMRIQGAGELVSLSDCPAQPASHIGCVPPFLTFMLGQLAPVAQDL